MEAFHCLDTRVLRRRFFIVSCNRIISRSSGVPKTAFIAPDLVLDRVMMGILLMRWLGAEIEAEFIR